MPTLAQYLPIKAKLAEDLQSAFPLLEKIFFGAPATPQTSKWFAVCDTPQIPMSFRAHRELEQQWQWEITVVFPLPEAGTDPLDDRVAQANKLIPVLEANTLYAGVGEFPTVTGVGVNRDDWVEGRHHFMVQFSFQVGQTWGT